jgi:hypothetical protein
MKHNLGAAFTLADATPEPGPYDRLSPDLRRPPKELEELLKKEIARLKENDCVNQWKAKKK